MLVVLSISILCLLLTFLEERGVLKNGMAIGFVLITIIQCLRFDYGTDYLGYYYSFDEFAASNYSLHDVFYGNLRRNNEYGWSFVLWLFSHTGKYGFFIMNIVLGIFENSVIYCFIKKRVSLDSWPLAVFIYLFTSSFYLMGFSMLRQYLSITLFIFSYSFIEQKRFLIALLLLFIASTIHQSAVLLLPFAFFGFLPIKKVSIYGFIFLAFFGILSISGSALDSVLELFLGFDAVEGYLESYGENASSGSRGLGFLLNTIPFVVSLYYLFTVRSDNPQIKLLVILACLGTMLVPFASRFQMVQRFSLYFSVFSIAAVPVTYRYIERKEIRLGLLLIFVVMHIYSYFLFFKDPSYIEKYSVYHTIFSAL